MVNPAAAPTMKRTDYLSEAESELAFRISEHVRTLTPETRAKVFERTDIGEDMDDFAAAMVTRLWETMGVIKHMGTDGILHHPQERAEFLQEFNSAFGVEHLTVAAGEKEQESHDGKYHSPIPGAQQMKWLQEFKSNRPRRSKPAIMTDSNAAWRRAASPLSGAGGSYSSTQPLTMLEIGGHQTAFKRLLDNPDLNSRSHINLIVTQGGSKWDKVGKKLLPNVKGNNNRYALKSSAGLFAHGQQAGIPTVTSYKTCAAQTSITSNDCDFRDTGHCFADTFYKYALELPKIYWDKACSDDPLPNFTWQDVIDRYTDWSDGVGSADQDARFAMECKGSKAECLAFETERKEYRKMKADHSASEKLRLMSQETPPDWETDKVREHYVRAQYDVWSALQIDMTLAKILKVFDETALQTHDEKGLHTSLGIPPTEDENGKERPGTGQGGLNVHEAEFLFKSLPKIAMVVANTSMLAEMDDPNRTSVRLKSPSERYEHVHTKDEDGIWRYEVRDTQTERASGRFSSLLQSIGNTMASCFGGSG